MDWIDSATAERSDLLDKTTFGFQRHDWPGMTLYSGATARGDVDLPEGHLSNQGLFCRRRRSIGPVPELRIAGSRWIRSRAPLTFFPAGMPYAARTRGQSDVVFVEFSSEFAASCQGHAAQS